jgi:molybdenum cofactor synthesis domain-containing protein
MTNDPTAAVLLIGNEILSGRTQDLNLRYIASKLSAIGVRLAECRVIADNPAAIVDAVNTLRSTYMYLFTTGGIGPTHDDITAQCVADAFAVPLLQHPEAVTLLTNYFAKRGVEANEARMRMANVPKGGELIENPVSVAPGFRVDNVYVMAGVPKIMQSMFEHVLPELQHGSALLSATVTCNLPEGDLSAPLAELQQRFLSIDVGSYPGKYQTEVPQVALVARGTDAVRLAEVVEELQLLVAGLGGDVLAVDAPD